MGTIPDVTTALAAQLAELDEVLAPLTDAEWATPSLCEGWSVADVVLHLAQTNEMATASALGKFDESLTRITVGGGGTATNVDEGAAIAVANERGLPNEGLLARWRASAADMREALEATDPHTRVTWVAGRLSVRTLTTTRLAETWIHAGDVAEPLGVLLPPTNRLWHIARLAWRTLPYAFAGAGTELSGPVVFDLSAPDGEDVWAFRDRDTEPTTYITGPAEELCQVAARRVSPADTGLTGEGPDADAVLALVRTYA
jgi:uncharacterized protein (TIGR03084 family)